MLFVEKLQDFSEHHNCVTCLGNCLNDPMIIRFFLTIYLVKWLYLYVLKWCFVCRQVLLTHMDWTEIFQFWALFEDCNIEIADSSSFKFFNLLFVCCVVTVWCQPRSWSNQKAWSVYKVEKLFSPLHCTSLLTLCSVLDLLFSILYTKKYHGDFISLN